MGNRAVITTTNALREDGSLDKNEIGIYLHWNGSPEDVQSMHLAIFFPLVTVRERKWRELAYCCKVDYNYRTGSAEVKRVRWNKKCVENAGRIL